MSKETKDIIKYLYKLEFLSPYMPSGKTIYDSNSNNKFDFSSLNKRKVKEKEKEIIYSIYVGNFNYDESVINICDVLNIEKLKNELGLTESIILGFKIRKTGEYLDNTFSLCNYIYGINEIIKNKSIDIELLESNREKIQSEILEKIDLKKFNYNNITEYLEKIIDLLKEKFPLLKEYISFRFIVIEEETFLKKQESDNDLSPAILPNFYLNDLDYLSKNISSKLTRFLSLQCNNKIEIDKDIENINKILSPNNYPLGKWPSKYHPALMQQIAINLTINKKDQIFSVNGPPGSGKTTLVKEVIVDIIVKRAREMLNYAKSDDAFTKIELPIVQNKFKSSFYKLDEKLNNYGILIASNNNNAVENISVELPLSKKVRSKYSLTDLFDTEVNDEIYFTEIAKKLFEGDYWGMISAPLGKKENINKFASNTWFKDNSLREYIDNYIDDFNETKLKFKDKLNRVEEYRKFLNKVKKDVEYYDEIKDIIKNKKKELNNVILELKELEKEVNDKEEYINIKNNENINYNNLIKDIEKLMPFYIRILSFIFKKHTYVIKRNELKEKILKNNKEIFDIKYNLIDLTNKTKSIENTIKSYEEEIDNLKQKMQNLGKLIIKYKEEDNIVIADKEYFKNIDKNIKSQESCPWTNLEYDKLREELFYEALKLHKSFILTSKAFKHNFSLFVDSMIGSLVLDNKKECFKDLLNTIFLFVPVISTSLASVGRFLDCIKEDEIGYLIIDEAGQATPASVLGVINRSRKTLVLGDPFQVEPVVTTPYTLYNILDYKKELNLFFRDNTLSAQILADYQNNYGANRGSGASATWIGCPLLLHRRCINPMFDISNKIAYEGKMFYCTNDDSNDKVLSIDKSIWLDIKGEEIGDGNHFVKEQGEKVLELVRKVISLSDSKLSEMYIISPFKTVANTMRKILISELSSKFDKKDAIAWAYESCGTIHTFQGKEINEVILLLGCSKNSVGAAKWAGSKPNILNVAVTRAKYRVVVIGDSEVWKDIPYFNTAYNMLKK